jgi:AhpD family alkylhydroperoxidase
MKKLIGLVVVMLAIATSVAAEPVKDAAAARAEITKMMGVLPAFMKAIPDVALPSIWEEMKTLQMNPETALSGKQKELIGLAVAAQIPCEYCIEGHTEFAKLNGASANEIGEAVAMAGLTRHWSTYLNGIQPDEAKFKADVMKTLDGMKKMMAGKAPPPKAIDVVDDKTAMEDITQTMGPAFADYMKRFPPQALAAAWRGEKDIEMSKTALDDKTKSLISLAVAAQIPCRYCIMADTEFAKLGGATDREISEAIAMAAFTREMSTVLNGMQVDKAQFKRDLDKIVTNAKKMAPKATAKAEK